MKYQDGKSFPRLRREQKDILAGKIQAINSFEWPDERLCWEQKDILTGGVLEIEIKN